MELISKSKFKNMAINNLYDNYNQLSEILNSIDNSNDYDSYQYNLKWLEDYRKTVLNLFILLLILI